MIVLFATWKRGKCMPLLQILAQPLSNDLVYEHVSTGFVKSVASDANMEALESIGLSFVCTRKTHV